MIDFVYIVFIGLIVLHFAFEFVADYLNDKYRLKPVPENVSDIFDEDSYKKWVAYSSEKNRLHFITSTLTFFVILILLLNGTVRTFANWTQDVTGNPYTEILLFIGIIMGINILFRLPFKYYNTFSIEERYGFNRSTKKTFVKDQIIGLILTVIFGGGILMLFTVFYENTSSMFVLYMFISLMVIFFLLNISYTKIFLPLFNKLTPLEDGELKTMIEEFAKTQHYEVKKIHVMDASRRSSKLNAFFSGFGRFKNVVLFDTLLNKLDNEEILSVLAHEIGHAKHKDTIKGFISSAVTFAILLGLFYGFIAIDLFYEAFGLESVHLGFMLFVFVLVVSPVMTLIGIVSNLLSRKHEYAADHFAAKYIKKAPMINALKKLARENFAQLTPHPLYVFLYYSHPPITDRISAIERVE